MKKILFSLFATVLIFNISFSQTNCDKLVIEGNNYKWEAIDPITAANLHNIYIEQAVKISLSDINQNDKDVLLKVKIPNVTNEYLSCLIDKISYTSDSEMDKVITSNLKEQASKNIYYEILESLTGDKSISDIIQNLSVLKNKINNLKTQKDKDILLTCLETGQASATFWLSKEKGGNGLGDTYTHEWR